MFDKYAYDKKYNKENYHHVNLSLPKEYKDLLTEAARKRDMSKNAFIKDAIEKQLIELNLL